MNDAVSLYLHYHQIKEDIDKLKKEIEFDTKRLDYRQKLTEFKKEMDDELSNFLQSAKVPWSLHSY